MMVKCDISFENYDGMRPDFEVLKCSQYLTKVQMETFAGSVKAGKRRELLSAPSSNLAFEDALKRDPPSTSIRSVVCQLHVFHSNVPLCSIQ